MVRNIGNKKKLTLVRITNSVGLHSKNNVNSVGMFNDSVSINKIKRIIG